MDKAASVVEVNFCCLVGPTHHFGGLSFGNLASTKNKARIANPKKAALQGLSKMKFLTDLGFKQAVLPPHERPHLKSLKNMGFAGPDHVIIREAQKNFPQIFSSLCSSSSMWAANAATVSPSIDAKDDFVHISPANLITMFHRSIEHEFTHRVLKLIFANEQYFQVHQALPMHDLFSDEGAANHNRLCPNHSQKGLQIFVYGKDFTNQLPKPTVFPARQSKIANEVLAFRHHIDPNYFLNIAQNPLAIDKGAFHNDVVAVANENVLLCHEMAFFKQSETLNTIRKRYQMLYQNSPIIIEINNKDLPIEEAISSYLFNSQLLTKPDGKMLLFSPMECQVNSLPHAVMNRIVAENNPISEVIYFDVSESMANGGGPACLRLRVPLTQAQLAMVKPTVLISDQLLFALEQAINKYYVDELTNEHFLDKKFIDNTRYALDEIANILGLEKIYDFQN